MRLLTALFIAAIALYACAHTTKTTTTYLKEQEHWENSAASAVVKQQHSEQSKSADVQVAKAETKVETTAEVVKVWDETPTGKPRYTEWHLAQKAQAETHTETAKQTAAVEHKDSGEARSSSAQATGAKAVDLHAKEVEVTTTWWQRWHWRLLAAVVTCLAIVIGFAKSWLRMQIGRWI